MDFRPRGAGVPAMTVPVCRNSTIRPWSLLDRGKKSPPAPIRCRECRPYSRLPEGLHGAAPDSAAGSSAAALRRRLRGRARGRRLRTWRRP